MSSHVNKYGSLALLFIAAMLNLFDRQIINVLAQDIKLDLHLSDAQLGLLTGTAFGLCYALLGIPLGRVADRTDRVKLIAAVIALWSCFTIACGVTKNFAQLFIMRMGVGVGEAGSQPATTALIPDLFGAESRSTAISIFQVGAPAGSFLGLLVGGYVASTWGWRSAFIVAGVPGLLLAIVIFVFMRDPRRTVSAAREHRSTSFAESSLDLAGTAAFRWLIAAMIFSTFLFYASGAWFPPMLKRTFELTTAEVGRIAAISVGIGGAIGIVGGGVLCDVLRGRIPGIESKVVIFALLLCIPPLCAAVLSTDRSTAFIAMFLFNVFAFAWFAPTVTLIQDSVAAENRALAIAICSSVSSLVSLVCGLPLVGLISDSLVATHGTQALGYALAMTIAPAAILAILVHWRLLHVER